MMCYFGPHKQILEVSGIELQSMQTIMALGAAECLPSTTKYLSIFGANRLMSGRAERTWGRLSLIPLKKR